MSARRGRCDGAPAPRLGAALPPVRRGPAGCGSRSRARFTSNGWSRRRSGSPRRRARASTSCCPPPGCTTASTSPRTRPSARAPRDSRRIMRCASSRTPAIRPPACRRSAMPSRRTAIPRASHRARSRRRSCRTRTGSTRSARSASRAASRSARRSAGRFTSRTTRSAASACPDDRGASVDHFYSKLLKLAGTMQTAAGRREAGRRTAFLEAFLAAARIGDRAVSRGVSARDALARLREGNARFAAHARGTGTLLTAARRAKLTAAPGTLCDHARLLGFARAGRARVQPGAGRPVRDPRRRQHRRAVADRQRRVRGRPIRDAPRRGARAFVLRRDRGDDRGAPSSHVDTRRPTSGRSSIASGRASKELVARHEAEGALASSMRR